jgi:hypothetical protein
MVLLALGWGPVARADITNGLIGWWTLDGRVGTALPDLSGSNNVGVLYNTTLTTATTAGVVRSAVCFDGINDYASMPSVNGWTNTAMTFALWIKRLSNNANWTQSISGPAGAIYVGGGGTYFRFQLTTTTGNKSCDAPFPLNEWIHVVGTWSYGDTLKLYTNGVLASQSAVVSETMVAGASFGLSIPYGGKYLNAIMDEPHVYNRALSLADVLELKASTAGPPPTDIATGLIGHWKFDAESGTTAVDASSHSNTGTLVNMNAATSSTNGVFGRALVFSGTNNSDYVNVSPLNGWNSNAMSIAVWARKLANPHQYSQLFGSGTGALYVNPSGGVFFQLGLAGFGTAYSGASAGVLGTEWTHVVGTFSKGDKIRLYVNGAQVEASVDYDYWMNSWTYLWFARYGSGTFMSAVMDEARLYSRALSSADVEALYFYQPPPPRGTAIVIR